MGALPRGDTALRPRLREDVRFVESRDGVYVHGDHGACTVRGRQAHALLARLAPALTGRRTLAELTAALPDDKRDMVHELVWTLVEHRFVVDAAAARPHGLSATELTTYAPEIAFIGYALDSPEWRFERIRRSRLVLVGEGPVLPALLESCVGTGWRDIGIVGDAVPEVTLRDPGQTVRAVDGIAGADLVVQVAGDLNSLLAMCRECDAAGVALAQVLVRPTEAWLTPVMTPSAASGWRRLAAWPWPAHQEEDLLIGPVPPVVAAITGLACFSWITGLDVPTDVLTRVDLRNLDTVQHRFLPLEDATGEESQRREPVARSGRSEESERSGRSGSRERFERAGSGEGPDRVSGAELEARIGEIVDPRTGLIGVLGEREFTQNPLAVCRAVVSGPAGALPGWAARPEVIGFGADRALARLRCLLAALAVYGVLAADEEQEGVELPTFRPSADLPGERDRERGTNGQEADRHGKKAGERGQERGANGQDVDRHGKGAGGHHWEDDGRGRESHGEVSASERRRKVRVRAHGQVIGLGAGLSWDDALVAGLRGHIEAILADGDADTADLPLAEPRPGPLARQYSLTGDKLEIRDATSLLGVPAYVLTVPGRTPLVSVAPTAAQAMDDGLERLLLRWQAVTSGQPAYADTRPLWSRGARPGDVELLAGALRAVGKVPVAVVLDRDAAAARFLPFVVRIVLCDE